MIELSYSEAHAILELQLGGYMTIRGEYQREVYRRVDTFLTTNQKPKEFKIYLVAAMLLYFGRASDDAWLSMEDNGAMDQDTRLWLEAQQNAETAYIENLGNSLDEIRKAGNFDAKTIAAQRADGYTKTLDRIYNNVKVSSAKDRMLTFGGHSGIESCVDCQNYLDQRHPAKWWREMDAVPPNRNFECGGWKCEHYLHDDKGYLYTF